MDLRYAVQGVNEKLVGGRVANIYDLNSKTYLLKIVKPDQKLFLVIESGVRFHSTNFSREKKDVPSVISLKVWILILDRPVNFVTAQKVY